MNVCACEHVCVSVCVCIITSATRTMRAIICARASGVISRSRSVRAHHICAVCYVCSVAYNYLSHTHHAHTFVRVQVALSHVVEACGPPIIFVLCILYVCVLCV